MRKVFALGVWMVWTYGLFAQVIPISNGSVHTCDGIFTDSGGDTGDYGPNENYHFTICPGTQGGNIRLDFEEAKFRPGDVLCFYDGTSDNEPLIACSTNFAGQQFSVQATGQSGCITTVFVSNAYQEEAGWKAQISCAPICQEIQARVSGTIPGAQDGYIDICAGEQVEFTASALFPNNNQYYTQSVADCSFAWDFGDGETATGQNVTHTFAQAGGFPVQLIVTDQNGCSSQNSINLYVRVASKPVLSTDALPPLCAGKTIQLTAGTENADVIIQQDGGEISMVKSHSDSLALPDGTGASYVSSVYYDEFNPNQTLQNASDLKRIFVNMEHSWMRDLEISITCPSGKSIILNHHPGNTGGEVFLGEPNELDEALPTPIPGVGYEYNWTSTATNPNWIDYANQYLPGTLPAGDYQPYEPFTNLVGCPLNGEWQIEVKDLWASDNGFIFAWGLEFDPSLYAQGESFQPEITAIQWQPHPAITTDNGATMEANFDHAGTKVLHLHVANDFGCTVDTSLRIKVLPPTAPQCYSCDTYKKQLPDTVVCVGQELHLDATYDKQAIEALRFDNEETQSTTQGPLVSRITTGFVTPGTIMVPAYRIREVSLQLQSDAPVTVQISLLSPSGKSLLLAQALPVNGNAPIAFSPKATESIANAGTNYGGIYKIEGDWQALQGEPTNGDWTLVIQQTGGAGTLSLRQWLLDFKNDVSVGYHWTGEGLSCTDCPTPTVVPSESGHYIVEVYDNTGCSYQDTAVVSVIESMPAPVIHDPVFENGKVIFTWEPVPNASEYRVKINNSNWITPNGNLSETLDGYAMGDEINFHVKALSAGGCDGNDANVQLKITDCLLTGNIQVVQAPTCQGINDGAVVLSATNGTPPFQYAFDGGTADTVTQYNGLSAGTHFAVFSDASGCFDTVVIDLTPVKDVTVNVATTDITCYGAGNGTATAQVINGTAPVSYTWQTTPVQNTQSINNLTAGTYTVSITDADGCKASGSGTISEPDALNPSFAQIQNVSCYGMADGMIEVAVTGGTTPYTYAWSSGETTASISGKAAGNYTVTVTDANGCSATLSTPITQPNSAVTVSAVQTIQSCAYLNQSKAMASATGGVAPYQYDWNNGQDNAIATNLAPGNYTVTATDANGCTASTSVSVSELPPVQVTMDFTEPTCHQGADGTVQVSAIQGGNSSNLSDYSFLWLNQADTDAILEQVAGDKTYYVTVTGTTGCRGTGSIYVTQPAPVEVSLTSTPVTCAGDKNGTAKIVQVTGNQGAYTVLWDTKANSATTEEVTDLAGDLYAVTVTDTKGCTGTNTVQVKEAPPLTILHKDVRHVRCAGTGDGLIDIAPQGGKPPYQFAWSNGPTTDVDPALNGGTYTVTITDAYGCQLVDSTQIHEPAPVVATTLIQTPNCYGESSGRLEIETTGGTPPYQFSLNNVSFDPESVIEDIEAGQYTIYVKDSNDCLFVDTITVTEPPEFTVDAGPDLQLAYGEVTTIGVDAENASGAISLSVVNPLAEVQSCTDCFELDIDPRYHGTYQIIATDERGCVATDEVEINITRQEEILVPTAFTPNGDGANDYLTCHSKRKAKVNFFRVYDRWGELVYEMTGGYTNENTGWDGSFRGKKLPPGAYIWTASVKFDTGHSALFKGQTNLIR